MILCPLGPFSRFGPYCRFFAPLRLIAPYRLQLFCDLSVSQW